MILLRSIELGGRCDFRNYPASETPLHLFLELFCRSSLLGVVKEDNRPVLCANVETLTIKSGGVMDLPEEVEKFLVEETLAASYSTYATSAYPVKPVQTSLYVGFSRVPPM
jgi:hypothetical protein